MTATVESIPLITASILSKKLAAGLQGLVMDVKTGSGAFMASRADSRALAESIVAVANGAGLKTTALITDMNQPLAPAAGNAVEVMNAVQNLLGARKDRRLLDVTIALGGEMLATGGLAESPEAGRGKIAAAIESGRAAEVFGKMVAALGGPSDLMEKPAMHLPAAPVIRPVLAGKTGIIGAIDTRGSALRWSRWVAGARAPRIRSTMPWASRTSRNWRAGGKGYPPRPRACPFRCAVRGGRTHNPRSLCHRRCCCPDFPLIAERVTDST